MTQADIEDELALHQQLADLLRGIEWTASALKGHARDDCKRARARREFRVLPLLVVGCWITLAGTLWYLPKAALVWLFRWKWCGCQDCKMKRTSFSIFPCFRRQPSLSNDLESAGEQHDPAECMQPFECTSESCIQERQRREEEDAEERIERARMEGVELSEMVRVASPPPSYSASSAGYIFKGSTSTTTQREPLDARPGRFTREIEATRW